jgi:hypothetical protein
MLEWLQRIFIGHVHSYEVYAKRERASHDGDPCTSGGTVFTMRCKHCGKMKQFDVF